MLAQWVAFESRIPAQSAQEMRRAFTCERPDMMSTCAPAHALDRSVNFQALAARTAVNRWLERQAQRAAGAHRQPWRQPQTCGD